MRSCLASMVFGLLALAFTVAAVAPSVRAQSKVAIERREDRFRLLRDGRPFAIRGVGGETRLAELVAAGGNSIRTWGSERLGAILDEAGRHGLTVCAGLWLGHPRHGFDYGDRAAVAAQLEAKLAVVREHKDHPALLMWGVGNEAEGEGDDPAVWRAINDLARAIRRIDPHHPTMTVLAELGAEGKKLRSLARHCPDVDVVGVNSYGGIESLDRRYRAAGGTKPYVVTEHGPRGPWEVGRTAWGSPIEETSTEKAARYAQGYRATAVEGADLCLGTYAFLWGHKQETTATWFGMWLDEGARLAAVDAMTEVWTGRAPQNRCPRLEALDVDRSNDLRPGSTVTAVVKASDPDGDAPTFRWVLRSDAGTVGMGGDPQEAESTFAAAVRADGERATVTLPAGGGGYRLFAYVFDGRGGAAVGNVPLHVRAPIALESVLPPARLPYVVVGDGAEGSVFVPSGYMGNVAAVRMELDCTDEPRSGETCVRAGYDAATSWGGILWQSPAGDWDGLLPGGANLSGATELEFWVRGARGGEVVNFVFGVLDGNQPHRDTAKGELRGVVLTKEWTRKSISLRGLDLRRIKTAFGWSLAGQGRPVTFFLDDVRYVRKD